jgi:plasmid maintenance system killer protein
MAGWLSFLRWLHFETKGRRYSFPLDHHRLVLMMRDFEEMREQNKSKVLSDEEKVYSVRVNKNDKVFF